MKTKTKKQKDKRIDKKDLSFMMRTFERTGYGRGKPLHGKLKEKQKVVYAEIVGGIRKKEGDPRDPLVISMIATLSPESIRFQIRMTNGTTSRLFKEDWEAKKFLASEGFIPVTDKFFYKKI